LTIIKKQLFNEYLNEINLKDSVMENMEIKISHANGTMIAEIISGGVIINDTQDALDIMAESNSQGASKMILHEKNVITDFFDLKTGIAGNILQKFTNYEVQLAIVGDFSKFTSKSLRDFIFESNKRGRINFVNSIEEAYEKLSK
jgi:hypothetical protein